MSLRVCLLANALYYPEGGGHLWAYLNWALGLRSLGCEVVWLEVVGQGDATTELDFATQLRSRLARYGLAERLALCRWSGSPLEPRIAAGVLDLEAAVDCDLLLNLAYNALAPEVVARFRRSALVDLDPGLTQLWVRSGQMELAPHDLYFTIGEGVGRPGARIPDCGLRWHHTPPPVALAEWPPTRCQPGAPFTTITHWGGAEIEIEGRLVANAKRDGFLPYLDLPRRTAQPLELALHLDESEQAERRGLAEHGWRLRSAHAVAATPWDYQAYIAGSQGEFSCAKPVYVRLGSAWVSDRTVCYLASAKPAVVEDTGESGFLPRDEGIFRFRNVDEAARHLQACAADPRRHGARARALAEEHFAAGRVLGRVLERAIS